MTGGTFLADGRSVGFEEGESVLVALLRVGRHPTGGGCLCLAGDCPHCLVSVDGVAYTRSCQVPAREGLTVESAHKGGAQPPLPPAGEKTVSTRHLHCDVVVLGGGAAGRAEAERARDAGAEVVLLDAGDGQEVAGIYPGPRVVARTASGVLQVHPRHEIVVATGAAEIQPVAPGAGLAGLMTARAAEALTAARIDLGRLVAVGEPPRDVDCRLVPGTLVCFEGEGRVEAVVTADADGTESRHPCDSVALGLGLHPRDALARMGRGLPVRTVGDAAGESDLPPCPRAGTVCPCAGVTVDDLDHVWTNGFRELELVKRATLAGTGTCQGSVCLPHVRSFLAERGRQLQPPFTARPLTRQLTMAEAAAGAQHRALPRTALHGEHLQLGAHMERAGGWWRPLRYPDPTAEYRAVREAVSIGDVSTLGKFVVSGPDALELLELLYPTRVATLAAGRARYVLLLDERGYVLDDGMILKDAADRFLLTLTSAGSSFGEMWIRDWAESRDFEVRILNQTGSLGAINVTGPRAAELLARAGVETLPGFARHRRLDVAGVDCRVLRLSFTGELSYELHHAAADSAHLWRTLLELGADLGIYPHGLDALLRLRLEKGHLIVGQDTAFDSTPRRLAHQWAVKLDKGEFIGRQAVVRTNREPLDRRLVGLQMELPAPPEGAVVWDGKRYAGFVTSATDSPVLNKGVLLAWVWLDDGEVPAELTVDGRTALRTATPFYDPENEKSRVEVGALATKAWAGPPELLGRSLLGRFERLEGVRLVADPGALDGLATGSETKALRIAADELLLFGGRTLPEPADRHAVVERETGFAGVWLESRETREVLECFAEWKPPSERPALAQGELAGIPVKLWLESERALLVVAAGLAEELTERLWGSGG